MPTSVLNMRMVTMLHMVSVTVTSMSQYGQETSGCSSPLGHCMSAPLAKSGLNIFHVPRWRIAQSVGRAGPSPTKEMWRTYWPWRLTLLLPPTRKSWMSIRCFSVILSLPPTLLCLYPDMHFSHRLQVRQAWAGYSLQGREPENAMTCAGAAGKEGTHG